ncbi:hypothetical protein [Streptomyces sp. NBC_00272]|uniref:hypothetical protein n=1 Tax=Streptomyces sp. NBC_00272 TaxID=2975698 RepID=UPI002E2D22F7|nr:hypothetical protein [Streptomyces sp. NBC_00272]
MPSWLATTFPCAPALAHVLMVKLFLVSSALSGRSWIRGFPCALRTGSEVSRATTVS